MPAGGPCHPPPMPLEHLFFFAPRTMALLRSLATQAARRCRPLPITPLGAGLVGVAADLPAAASICGSEIAHFRPISFPLPHASTKTTSQHFFSSAAQQLEEEADDPTPKRKARSRGSNSNRPKLNPIIVTDRAAARIQELLSGPSAEGAIGIRLGVKRRGCNGLSYTLNYAFEKPEKDEEMEAPLGIKVFIEPMALFNVVGTVMDFEETELSSEFTFNNPNSKGECGCGESFNV